MWCDCCAKTMPSNHSGTRGKPPKQTGGAANRGPARSAAGRGQGESPSALRRGPVTGESSRFLSPGPLDYVHPVLSWQRSVLFAVPRTRPNDFQAAVCSVRSVGIGMLLYSRVCTAIFRLHVLLFFCRNDGFGGLYTSSAVEPFTSRKFYFLFCLSQSDFCHVPRRHAHTTGYAHRGHACWAAGREGSFRGTTKGRR